MENVHDDEKPSTFIAYFDIPTLMSVGNPKL